MRRVVLAWSGGSASADALAALAARQPRAEIVTLTVDVGEQRDLPAIRERALALGATRAHVIDAREEFVRDYVVPAAQAMSTHAEGPALGVALAWPLIARHLVAIADMEGADTVAHGACRGSADARRLARAIASLRPSLAVLAPCAGVTDRDDERHERARTPAGAAAPSASARRERVHLAGRFVWGAGIDDPALAAPEDALVLTRAGAGQADVPADVVLRLEVGIPVSINGVSIPLGELFDSLGTIGAAHGVGRGERIWRDRDGVPRRVLHEAPAVVLLAVAHAALLDAAVDRATLALVRQVGQAFADLVDAGGWFTPARAAIDAFVRQLNASLTGTTHVRLAGGHATIIRRALDPPAAAGRGHGPRADAASVPQGEGGTSRGGGDA